MAASASNPRPVVFSGNPAAAAAYDAADVFGPAPGDPVETSPPRGGREVLDAADVVRALTRIAHEILERTKGGADVVLLGIPTRGIPLAQRIGARMSAVENRRFAVGSLDVTMFRDDLRMRPARALARTEIPEGGVDGKTVVLVDDVLFSGRTVRAALDALNELGRPRAVQLAVLVDRGHRELPIKADYVGKNLPTALHEQVTVFVDDVDGRDAVLLSNNDDPELRVSISRDHETEVSR